MLKAILSLFFIIGFSSAAPAPDWKLTSKLVDSNKIKISQLTWQKGKQKQMYRPNDIPWGMTDSKVVKINKRSIWLTTWANTTRVTFRVFDPSVKNTPLCEVDSAAEETQLRVKKGNLQIKVLTQDPNPGGKAKPSWVVCRKKF